MDFKYVISASFSVLVLGFFGDRKIILNYLSWAERVFFSEKSQWQKKSSKLHVWKVIHSDWLEELTLLYDQNHLDEVYSAWKYFNIEFSDINDCDPNPCKNNGTCIDALNGNSCECVAGFNGSDCEISKWEKHFIKILTDL